PIAEPERAPAGALLALLEENERIGPAHFAFRRQDGRVHLYRPLPNRGVTAAVMRKQLDAFDELVRRTEKLWDPDNFKPAAPDAGERARLRGTWKVVAIEQKGAKLSEADVAASRMSLTFTPDKLIIRRKGAPDDV